MRCFLIAMILSCPLFASSQQKDSLIVNDSGTVIRTYITGDTVIIKKDSVKKHSPRQAAIRSAILPGLGQVYNKKYWKVPLVYAAIGIPAYTFFYNKQWFDRTREAARMIAENDTTNFRSRVDPRLYDFFTRPNSIGSLLRYRNEFRRDMDYSVLFFVLLWGLNVVDATVDAHLRGFDISEDLSLKIKPNFERGAGVSVVLNFRN